MQTRKATINDAEAIARHLLEAMEDIVYAFIGERDHAKVPEFMSYFTGTGNNGILIPIHSNKYIFLF